MLARQLIQADGEKTAAKQEQRAERKHKLRHAVAIADQQIAHQHNGRAVKQGIDRGFAQVLQTQTQPEQ